MVDNKDILILDTLKENAKASIAKVAKKTGLPPTTVHNRVKKLEKEKIIKKYTIEVDNKRIGKEIAAFVAMTADYSLLKRENKSQFQLAKEIGKLPDIEEISLVTGGTDIIAKIRVKDIEELNKYITKELRNIDGVEKTQTMVILKEVMD